MATPSSDDVPGSADRISPRHAFETRIWIRLQRDGKKLSLQGWSRDLSESGVGAFVAEALILSESVTLEIPLPDCDKQVIPAKVVRALGTEYGFQFTALSAEQRRQIRATLKERPAIPVGYSGLLPDANFCFCFSIAPSIHFLRPLSAQFLRAFSNLSSSARIIAISASTSQKLLLRREGNHYT